MKDKIVMVTGANSGIGRVTATQLAKMGATVVMVCRNQEKGIAVRDDINAEIGMERTHLLLADFSDQASIRKMAEAFKQKFDRLDILINNAGGVIDRHETTVDGFEWMMGVNHFGYFLTTHYLLETIPVKQNSRIINVASMAHRMGYLDWSNMNAEKKFSTWGQYGLTKLCNILFTNYLAKQLEPDRITVNALHPGVVHSNFGKNTYPALVNRILQSVGDRLMLTPEKGARTTIYLATSPEVSKDTGMYFVKCKRVHPSSAATDMENAHKLWNWSLEKTGIQQFGAV